MEEVVDRLLQWWPLTAAPVVYGIWFKTFLSGPNWTARIRGWLENERWSVAYAEMLGGLNRRLDALFGERLFGWRSFNLCLRIAVGYALLWFWLAFAASSVGGAIGWLVLLFATAISFALAFGASRTIRRRHEAARALRPERRHWLTIREHLGYLVVGIVAFAFAFAFAFAVAFAVAVAVAGEVVVAGAGAFAGAFAGAGAGAFAGAVAVAGAFAGAGAGAVASADAGAVAGAVVVLALLGVPLINALFDWPSWAASRWLVRRLGSDARDPLLWRRWALLVGHVVLDVALALLALFGLAILLAFIFPNLGEWLAARNTPFLLKGSAISVMLLSTLVPTALHLFCAVFAIFPALPFGQGRVVGFLPFRRNFSEFETGDKAIVSAWLTLWTVLSAVIVWLLMVEIGPWLLDRLTTPLVWGVFGDGEERSFWQALFDAARAIQQWSGIALAGFL